MSKTRIQLTYSIIENEPTFKFQHLKNYEANNYFKNLPYLDEINKPEVQNDALNLIKNKPSFRKYLLATSDLGNSLQDIINQVVTDGEFNDVGLRRVLDSQNNDIFKISNPLSLIFKNAQKFNLQNPILGDLVNQIYASGLTDENVKKLLQKGDEDIIQKRLDSLNSFNNRNNNNNNNNDGDDFDDFDGRDLPNVPIFDTNDVLNFNQFNTTPKQRQTLKKSAKVPPPSQFSDNLPNLQVKVRDGLEFDKDFDSTDTVQVAKTDLQQFPDFNDGGEQY